MTRCNKIFGSYNSCSKYK